ncbi:MAG: glycosyltransferase family 1 protein [Chitinivibrionales bacterium]|nr:glycosyltransferase family 1 protein [Chitinivibrionales bacterium]
MKFLLITDGWFPQTSGVVRTFGTLVEYLKRYGHQVEVIHPLLFMTLPCPTYPSIPLAVWPGKKLQKYIKRFHPDAIHIATEGPLGIAARLYLTKKNIPFTTSYTTRFPEYIHARVKIPEEFIYTALRWFHAASRAVMVATESLQLELQARGFNNCVLLGRGVDCELFRPRSKDILSDPRPIFMYVGRVALEKNITAFLDLKLSGTKYVVGEGPQLSLLKNRYPAVQFPGILHGEALARYYAAADVFVFPSMTDTFGLVILEALASGVPVAAYPVAGPRDILGKRNIGVMSTNLAEAAEAALALSPVKCRNFALQFSWDSCTHRFLNLLHPIAVKDF